MTKVKDDTLPEIEIELEEVTPLNNMESIEEQPEAQVEEVSAFETVFFLDLWFNDVVFFVGT